MGNCAPKPVKRYHKESIDLFNSSTFKCGEKGTETGHDDRSLRLFRDGRKFVIVRVRLSPGCKAALEGVFVGDHVSQFTVVRVHPYGKLPTIYSRCNLLWVRLWKRRWLKSESGECGTNMNSLKTVQQT